MKAVIIGSGNVATHLAKALAATDVQVKQIWSYHYENALVLADEISAVAIKNLAAIDPDISLCFIAVKDDAIGEIVAQLKGFNGLVVHTSGAVAINVFDGYITDYGIFYPLQTFSKNRALSFSNIPLCIEANTNTNLERIEEIAAKMSRNVVRVNSEKRKILHLAAVFACNFTNHLYALAEDILKEGALEFDLIRPLISETAAKIENALPLEVQTGPAVRNDEKTLIKHQQLLLQQPQLLEIYKTLSESIKKTRS